MIYIVDNGMDYSSKRIYFIDIDHGAFESAVVELVNAVSGSFGRAKLLGEADSDGISWFAGKPIAGVDLITDNAYRFTDSEDYDPLSQPVKDLVDEAEQPK
jgi:hypothetical protein